MKAGLDDLADRGREQHPDLALNGPNDSRRGSARLAILILATPCESRSNTARCETTNLGPSVWRPRFVSGFQTQQIELVPSSGGRFEVSRDGVPVYEKSKTGRHAKPGEILAALAERRGPADELALNS